LKEVVVLIGGSIKDGGFNRRRRLRKEPTAFRALAAMASGGECGNGVGGVGSGNGQSWQR